MGKDDAVALSAAGLALAFVVGDLDDGAALTDRALALNPNLAVAWLSSGWVNVWLGEPEVSIERFARAMRLSPQDPQFFNMQAGTGAAHFIAGRPVEALAWAASALRDQPHLLSACTVAASSALTGRPAEAERAMSSLRQLYPDLHLSNLTDLFPIRRLEHFALWKEALRKAGLPE